jgi:ribokinase
VKTVPEAGDIVHGRQSWRGAAGGGSVAAVQVARMTGGCDFYTAVGGDELGAAVAAELGCHGVEVHAARRDAPQRRAFVLIDGDGERTITTIGRRLGAEGQDSLPWSNFDDMDAAYFTAGDAEALRQARGARHLVATVRARKTLAEAGVKVDVLVASENDKGEHYVRGGLDPQPTWVVRTDGARGGTVEDLDGDVVPWKTRSLAARPVPGDSPTEPSEAEPPDNYGAGDSFAAGLTCGLGMGFDLIRAIELGAYCGACATRGRAPFGGQATEADLPHWREVFAIPD